MVSCKRAVQSLNTVILEEHQKQAAQGVFEAGTSSRAIPHQVLWWRLSILITCCPALKVMMPQHCCTDHLWQTNFTRHMARPNARACVGGIASQHAQLECIRGCASTPTDEITNHLKSQQHTCPRARSRPRRACPGTPRTWPRPLPGSPPCCGWNASCRSPLRPGH